MEITVRGADATEVDAIADVWWHSWHQAHADIVPESLVELRTLASFGDRARKHFDSIRVVGDVGQPQGFCYVVGAELQQLFVSSAFHGAGVASALIADAERILRKSGVATAWLACAFGNKRAERFYHKQGWSNVGTMLELLETSVGDYELETWRFEKRLSAALEGEEMP